VPQNAVLVNFTSGETSPRSRGRFDTPWYQTAARKLVNWIAELTGPARYRPGFMFLRMTRQGQAARMAPFQLSSNLGYMVEFTPGKARVWSKNVTRVSSVTGAITTITAATKATPGSISVADGTYLKTGSIVLISGVVGMTQLNNMLVSLVGPDNTPGPVAFFLHDPVTGASINTTAFSTYTSGGSVSRVLSRSSGEAWDLVTSQPTTVTGITNASPGVVTVRDASLLSNGDEVIITGAAGMPQVNNRQFQVGGLAGSTFQLKDPVTGANVDTSAWGVYTMGGAVNKVREFATSFGAADLPNLQWASTGGTMYLVCGTRAPAKFTADGFGTFTFSSTYARTNDPFTGAAGALTITGITKGTSTIVTFAGGPYSATTPYTFSGVGGMVNLNGNTYYLRPQVNADGTTSYVLFTVPAGGVPVDSSAWAAWTTGGVATPAFEYPLSVGFYEGRLVFGGSNFRPDCLFASRSPDPSTGAPRYDDFTGGTDATDACFFQFAAVGGVSSYIAWVRGGPDYLFSGTFGGPFRVSGSGLDIPITPTSVNVRQFDDAGAAATMAAGLAQMFFVQRGGATVRSIKVINPYLASFESADLCLNAEQVGYSPLQRVVFQHGRPDSLWTYRADGGLCNMSVRVTAAQAETVTGWARHFLGAGGLVTDIAVSPRSTGMDQLWAVMSYSGVNWVGIMADDVIFPDLEDFFTGDDNQAADLAAWKGAVYRLAERYHHLDAGVFYDGSARGVDAAATLTPGAGYGTQDQAGVVLTASQPVFSADDVGNEIWKKPNAGTGVGGGRALITAFTDSQHVVVTIKAPFDSGAVVAAGDWHVAVSKVHGLYHLIGQSVAVVVDGAVVADGGLTGDYDALTVAADGSLTLPAGSAQLFGAVIRSGHAYEGDLESHNLEMGGRLGPAQDKPRRVTDLFIRFLSSLGVEYGTDQYNLVPIEDRDSDAAFDRVAPVFSGIREVPPRDSSSGLTDATREKIVMLKQRKPLPAVVQFIDVNYETTDE
jgi:hypothetical protein